VQLNPNLAMNNTFFKYMIGLEFVVQFGRNGSTAKATRASTTFLKFSDRPFKSCDTSTRSLVVELKSTPLSARTGRKLFLPMATKAEQPVFLRIFPLRMPHPIKMDAYHHEKIREKCLSGWLHLASGGSSVQSFFLYSKHEFFKRTIRKISNRAAS
jgi:hypothetical protein